MHFAGLPLAPIFIFNFHHYFKNNKFCCIFVLHILSKCMWKKMFWENEWCETKLKNSRQCIFYTAWNLNPSYYIYKKNVSHTFIQPLIKLYAGSFQTNGKKFSCGKMSQDKQIVCRKPLSKLSCLVKNIGCVIISWTNYHYKDILKRFSSNKLCFVWNMMTW